MPSASSIERRSWPGAEPRPGCGNRHDRAAARERIRRRELLRELGRLPRHRGGAQRRPPLRGDSRGRARGRSAGRPGAREGGVCPPRPRGGDEPARADSARTAPCCSSTTGSTSPWPSAPTASTWARTTCRSSWLGACWAATRSSAFRSPAPISSPRHGRRRGRLSGRGRGLPDGLEGRRDADGPGSVWPRLGRPPRPRSWPSAASTPAMPGWPSPPAPTALAVISAITAGCRHRPQPWRRSRLPVSRGPGRSPVSGLGRVRSDRRPRRPPGPARRRTRHRRRRRRVAAGARARWSWPRPTCWSRGSTSGSTGPRRATWAGRLWR